VSFAIVRFLVAAWIPFLSVILGLCVGCLVAALWTERKFLKEIFSMKTTKQGMSMGAHLSLVFLILIAVNFVAVRKYKTFDFSMAKINTLSEQSVQLVKDLQDDLSVFYFYKNGTQGVDENRRAFIDLMKKYQDQTDKIKLQFVELNEHPDLAEKYNIHQGTQVVVLDYQGRQSRIEKIEEQELTSGIVKVTRKTDKRVYILTGHQELDTQAQKDGSSLVLLKELLTGNRYSVLETSFNKVTQVPDDADVLLIAGPRQGFLDVEVKAIEDYLKKGGSVVLALASGFKTGLEPLLQKVGIQPKNNYVTTLLSTPFGTAVDPRFTRGSVFSTTHQITKPFGNNQYTVFRLPQGLVKQKALIPELAVDEIVKSNDAVMSFKDTHFDANGEKGPVTFGMAIKGKWDASAAKDFNLLVFADPNFLNDQYLYQNLNRDLLLNSVAFLAKEENLISITPKEIESTVITMTDTQFVLFLLGFAIPLPLVLFAGSGWFWYRRRYS
jgi:hypothetical protein